jgi:putative transposase
MQHRVVDIAFNPGSSLQWHIHGAVRREAARLWARIVKLHAYIRRRNWRWPSKRQLEKWAKGKFPGLHSQSVQQTIAEFLEAVESTRQKRKNLAETGGAEGLAQAKYPWKTPRYRSVTFTNQAPRRKGNRLVLPCGTVKGKRVYLSVPLPKGFVEPGRLMQVRLEFCAISLVYAIAEEDEVIQDDVPVVAGDLGVNTLIAATDGVTAVAVSGRAVKSFVQYRNKKLAEISERQARHQKGSKRWKRLQRAKKCMLAKQRRKVRDAAHKATRIVADAFPDARAIVGKPFNDAAQKTDRRRAQTVSQAVNGMLIRYLDYKLAGAELIEEHWTSQTCPVCGSRRKCGRIYSCSDCGLTAPRDVVGALNIRTKGLHGEIQKVSPHEVPQIIKYRRVPLGPRRSSAGHAARCSDLQPFQKAA